MDTTSLIVWLALSSVVSLAVVLFIVRSEKMAEFGTGRRVLGSIVAVFVLFLFLLPILFVPSIGLAGALVIMGAIALMVLISAWKWWLLWIPWPF